MSHRAILVFTGRSLSRILAEGGCQAWSLNRRRAREADYVVCARNTHPDWGDATEPHGAAFLVGRIADVVPAPEDENRWMFLFSEYARVELPDVWRGWRNPVRYTTLEEIGIDPETLAFRPFPEVPEARARLSDQVPVDDAGIGSRIAAVVRLYRSKNEAGEAAGVSRDQLSRYEQGRNSAPFEALARLAVAKNVDLNWLATGSGKMLLEAPTAKPSPVAESVLAETLRLVEDWISADHVVMTPGRKASIVARLYAMALERGGSVDETAVRRILSLVSG